MSTSLTQALSPVFRLGTVWFGSRSESVARTVYDGGRFDSKMDFPESAGFPMSFVK